MRRLRKIVHETSVDEVREETIRIPRRVWDEVDASCEVPPEEKRGIDTLPTVQPQSAQQDRERRRPTLAFDGKP